MLWQNWYGKMLKKGSYNNSRQEISHCPNSIFISLVTEDEVVSLAKNLKDQLTAGYDDIPKSLVNPLPLLFKSLLHRQKDCVFSAGI